MLTMTLQPPSQVGHPKVCRKVKKRIERKHLMISDTNKMKRIIFAHKMRTISPFRLIN
jgi:hypothetical protein